MNRDGFSPWEEIIILALIAIFIGVVYHRYTLLQKRALKVKTKVELDNLKLAVTLYRVKVGKNPPSLYELYKQGFIYYEGFFVDKKRRKLLDDLGNSFIYDNETGKVYINPKTVEKLK